MFKINTIVAAAGLLVAVGCAGYRGADYVAEPGYAASHPTVAVMQFTNLTNHPKAGAIVADILTTALYESSHFTVMSKEDQVSKVGSQFSLMDINTELKAAEIGQALGVDAVIFGSVSEYQYRQGFSENPVVGINLRMVDVNTGKIVWAASHTNAGGSSLNSNTQEICDEMIEGLLRVR